MHCRNGSRAGRKWSLCTRGTLIRLQMCRWLLQDMHESWCQLRKLPQEWIQACAHCQSRPHPTASCMTQLFLEAWALHLSAPNLPCGLWRWPVHTEWEKKNHRPTSPKASFFIISIHNASRQVLFVSVFILSTSWLILSLECKFYEGRTGIICSHLNTMKPIGVYGVVMKWKNEEMNSWDVTNLDG